MIARFNASELVPALLDQLNVMFSQS